MANVFLKSGYLTLAGMHTVRELLTATEEERAPYEWGKPLPSEYACNWVRFHGVRSHGRGRFVSISYSMDEQARELLTALKVPFTEGNDAPRGGRTGVYLRYDLRKLRNAIMRSIKIA